MSLISYADILIFIYFLNKVLLVSVMSAFKASMKQSNDVAQKSAESVELHNACFCYNLKIIEIISNNHYGQLKNGF